jgi:hypothetical protein
MGNTNVLQTYNEMSLSLKKKEILPQDIC